MMERRRRAGGRGMWRFCFPLLGWSVATSVAAGDGGAAKAAEAVWADLVPDRYRERAAFDWVTPREGKAKVFVYGDSISIGYTPFLREELAEEADVFRLHTNGGHSGQVVNQTGALLEAMGQPGLKGGWHFHWDVVVFNCGLHDLKYVAEDGSHDVANGRQVHSLEEYRENLERIIAYFGETFPQARLVFVTTTPVPEDSAGRVAGDAARYNKAALDVLRAHPGIHICDLFGFSKPKQEAWWVAPGNVHYTEEGCRQQGLEVARAVRAVLP